MNATKLFLFDLDGTLMSTSGAGMRALSRAFEELHGIPNATSAVNPSGKTDPAIFRELFKIHLGREMQPNDLAETSKIYLRYLATEIQSPTVRGALPGVVQFLRYLTERPDILVGLGTGNLEPGARIKLGVADLNQFFAFGGFGSDAEDRVEVLRAGHRRAEAKAGHAIPAADVYVLGDTGLDITAARGAGYQAVGVATGGASYEDLEKAAPDFLLADLTGAFGWLEEIERGCPSSR
jgi:phosphoglycolate phosphatase